MHRKAIVGLLAILMISVLLTASCAAPGASAQAGAGGAAASGAAAEAIENKGSDTLVNLALAWAEAYMGEHPEARISVTGGGSGTGIAAMINGTVDIANASREMKQEEIDAAKKNGIDPVQHVVAKDAIAVVVHPSNPVKGLTLQQISDIYTRQDHQLAGGGRRGQADRAVVARVKLGHIRILSRGGHPAGQDRATCCFRRTPCSCLPLRGSAPRSPRTRMRLAMMGWDM